MGRREIGEAQLVDFICTLDKLSGKTIVGDMFEILYRNKSTEKVERGFEYWAPRAARLKEKHARS